VIEQAQEELNTLPMFPIEQLVSQKTGKPWRATHIQDMTEYASHPCAILSDGAYAVFAKFSDAANGAEQFEIELAGLQLLAAQTGIRIPTPIGIVPMSDGSILILEAVRAVERRPRQWRQIGRTLARIHQVKGERFGLERHGYFGPLPQENTPTDDWPTFYGERRLRAGLKMAVDAGRLPPGVTRQVEKLITRLPELCGPEVMPTLLHGDAQQNNYISTETEAVVIDPAVYYGHPEIDLAYIDYFQSVPDDVFDGYREVMAIDAGFWERRELWRIWGYLAVVTVGGSSYLDKLSAAVRKYV
jgi:fructosamine-3-kinase